MKHSSAAEEGSSDDCIVDADVYAKGSLETKKNVKKGKLFRYCYHLHNFFTSCSIKYLYVYPDVDACIFLIS